MNDRHRDAATEREKRLRQSDLGAGDSDPARTHVGGTALPQAEAPPHRDAPPPPGNPPPRPDHPGNPRIDTLRRDAGGRTGQDDGSVARDQASMGKRNTPPSVKPVG